jgi:RimJ/RimL family protein N-acetyltransferase
VPTGELIDAGRVTLHPLTVADAAEMAGVLSSPGLYRYTGGAPPTTAELSERYARQAAGWSPDGREEWLNLIVRTKAGGQAVGYVQATITEAGQRAEVAWVIGEQWQGQGHASAAALALARWLHARRVPRLQAHIRPDHVVSAAVARRAGLRRTGLIEGGEEVWEGEAG